MIGLQPAFIAFFICFIFPQASFADDWTVWSSQELGVRFSYDGKWVERTPTQDATRVVISWLEKKSKGLIATCYLSANDSSFGRINARDIHDQAASISAGIKRNTLKRSDEYKQLSVEKRYCDNYPVIYMNQTTKVRGLDGDDEFTTHSLITAWNNKEIMFSCGSDIPLRAPQYKEPIEKQMMNVLRTLQFDRK